MDRRFYMNSAWYYHGPPGEQGDTLETSLAYGMGIHVNWLLSIYCMFTVQESDIVKNIVVITRRMIDEFRRADGWIDIVRRGCFGRFPHRKISTTNSLFKKGQHSLVKSVTLKAPTELLYDSLVCYTISQRCTAPRIAIPSRTNTVDAAVQLHSALLNAFSTP